MAKISQLTDNLYIGKTPKGTDWDELIAKNIKLIINMRIEWRLKLPRYLVNNIVVLWLPTVDFFLYTISIKTLNKGVEAAIDTIHNGGNVYVHCKQGRHRSVAMAASILIAQGMSTKDAISLIKNNHPTGDPEAKHIYRAIKNFAVNYSKKAK